MPTPSASQSSVAVLPFALRDLDNDSIRPRMARISERSSSSSERRSSTVSIGGSAGAGSRFTFVDDGGSVIVVDSVRAGANPSKKTDVTVAVIDSMSAARVSRCHLTDWKTHSRIIR